MINKKKIGILINSEREFDYYNNLLKKFPKKYFQIILNDFKNQVNYKRFKNFIWKEKKFFLLASNCLRQKEKVSIILSTGLGPLKKYSILSIIHFIYARLFGVVFVFFGLDRLFNFFFKRSFTGGAGKSKLFQVEQIEKKLSEISICYPRGLDINIDSYPQKRWIKTFDYFFCHCKIDYQILKNKIAKKKLKIIGYPRYQLNHSSSKKQNIKKKINKEFLINKDKKILFWIPTIINKEGFEEISNITLWIEQVVKFAKKNKYIIILRPHPKIDKKNFKILLKFKQKYKIKIDCEKGRNLNEIYLSADLVITDYGGSVFSALYHMKKIILLNLPKDHFYVKEKINNLSQVKRKSFVNVNLSNGLDNIEKLVKKKDFKKLKENIFGKKLNNINEIKNFLKII